MEDPISQPGSLMPFAEEARVPGTYFSDGPMLPEMVVIPPGKFWMGADASDRSAKIVEKPRHWVQIAKSLAVSRYPITFEQWDAHADGDPEIHRPDDCGWGRGRRPVVNISWEDAENYVSRLSITAGRPYRLLSEAEWEYCCRAGTIPAPKADLLRPNGGDRPGAGRTLPVGSFRPNAFGLFDVGDNVRELVADAWHDAYLGAPTDGSAWGQNEATMWRVVRGGGWDAPPLRSCCLRDRIHHIQRMNNTGFRIACGLE
jgi:formylglycine-generating enzyme required for sulfatase activity